MAASGVAEQTLKIVSEGRYRAHEREVDLRARLDAAIGGTVLYRPSELDDLLGEGSPAAKSQAQIEVTGETTAAAARRAIGEGASHVVALNFASAKNPGGGFLRGAKAQEEDLARCSALYTCQLEQPTYYAANRGASLLYTDHLIYSPAVPFFRDEDLELLEEPFLLSVITSPAPNAGEVLRNEPKNRDRIASVLAHRAGHVLAVAEARAHRTLILGAWGCGVFRNDPAFVAEAFDRHLNSERFATSFDRVIFAVYDRGKNRDNHRAFSARFA